MRNLLRKKEKNPFEQFKLGNRVPKQPETLIQALSLAQETGLSYKVKVGCREDKSPASSTLLMMPIHEAVPALREDAEAFCRATWGGGKFTVEFFDPDGRLRAGYSFDVGGATPYRSPGKSAPGSGGNGTGGRSNDKFVEFLVEDRKEARESEVKRLEIEGTRMDRMYSEMSKRDDRYLELITSGSKDSSLMDEMTVTLFNNVFAKDQNRISDMRDMMELGKLFVPQVQPESEMTQLLGTLGTLATAFLTRNTAASPSSAAHAVSSYIDQIPPEQIASMLANKSPDEITAFLNQLTGSVGPSLGQPSVSLPAPGESRPEEKPLIEPATPASTTLSPIPTPGEDLAAAEVSPSSPTPPDPHLVVSDQMIQQWRDDISSGTDAAQLARSLIGIVHYAQSLAEPPAALVGFIEVTDDTFDLVFARFCQAVPELAASPGIALQLRTELLRQLSEAHEEHVRAEVGIPTDAGEPEVIETEDEGAQPPMEGEDVPVVGGPGRGDDPDQSAIPDSEDGEPVVGETDDTSQAAAD